eukprot:2608712-Lingulodinium_polyedra.AAC.1
MSSQVCGGRTIKDRRDPTIAVVCLAVAIAWRLFARGAGVSPGRFAQAAAKRIAIVSAYTSDAREAERQLGIAYLSPDTKLRVVSCKGLSPQALVAAMSE